MLNRTGRWIVAGIAALALAVGGAGRRVRGTPSPPPSLTGSPSTTAGTTMPTTTADPATATATSRPIAGIRALVAALALAGAATLAACGASGGDERAAGPPAPANPAAFAWVHPVARRPGWSTRRPALRGRQPSPTRPGWRLSKTDPGTVTATLRRPAAGSIGYLNITPQGGDETLANWASFRPAHNREEGDSDLVPTRLGDRASASGLRQGSCVKDRLRDRSTSRHYTEIACIVRGRTATTVIVGAAPPRSGTASRR